MRGAQKRRLRALSDLTKAAWIGAQADPDGLQQFLDSLEQGSKKPLPPEAMGRALESMAQKMAVISMDDYRARLKGHG